MEVNGIGLAQPGDSTARSAQSLAGTFDTFLQLLTTQLQHQDPLSPLDSNQFTEQLVQYSGVEQAINTNKKLDQLIGFFAGNQLNAAVSYIGKIVEFSNDRFALENETATIGYELANNAAEARISIVDGLGRVVRTVPADTAAGRHEIVWDGRDDNGAQLSDGIYGVFITAVDNGGTTIDAKTLVSGRVTGVEQNADGITLNVGALDVPLGSVRTVREPDQA